MKTIKTRILSLILCFVLLGSILPLGILPANAATYYNVDAALAYAAAHWNDQDGSLCAQFVSRCLVKGGITFSAETDKVGGRISWDNAVGAYVYRGCWGLFHDLEARNFTQVYTLKQDSYGRVRWDQNEGKISKGDVIFYYNPSKGGTDVYYHTVIAGYNSATPDYVTAYAHNNAKNNTVVYGDGDDLIVVHFTNAAQVSPRWSVWMSDSKMGSTPNEFKAGNIYYLCYKLYDYNTGAFLDSVANYNYTVTETIYNPDGSLGHTYQYGNDNNWIGLPCLTPGTYTYKVVLDGDLLDTWTGSFVVKDNPTTIAANKSSVSLNLATKPSDTVTFTIDGYSQAQRNIGYKIDGSGFTCAWDGGWENGKAKLKITGTKSGSGTVNITVRNSESGEALATTSIRVNVVAPSYTVSYHANGGTGAPQSQTANYGTPITLSSVQPKGSTYTVTFNGNGGTVAVGSKQYTQKFDSWNTRSDGTGQKYASGSVYSDYTSVTLYAKYLDPDLGNIASPSRPGYYFIGWYDSPNTDSYGRPTGKHYPITRDITNNITLYAMWSKSATFLWGDSNLNGEINVLDASAINKLIHDNEAIDDNLAFRCDVNADGKVSTDDSLMIQEYCAELIAYEDFPAYQLFRGISVGTYPKTTFAYGEPLDTAGLGLTAKYSNGTTYLLTENYLVSGYDPYHIGKQTIQVEFYQFSTSYTVTVEPPEYTLYFDANGGTVDPYYKTVTYDRAIGTLPQPEREGYLFLGWSYGKSDATYVSASTPYSYMENKTLYAHWQLGCDAGIHQYVDTVIPPSCTEQGYTLHTCSVCGSSYKDSYTAMQGHDYTYHIMLDPTTQTVGTLLGSCSRCGNSRQEELPALNTADYSYELIKTASCAESGLARYTWKNTTYGVFSFEVKIEQIPHNYTTQVIEPTCTEYGYTTHTCSVCGESYADNYKEFLGHAWDNGTVTIAPTEDTSGTRTYRCTRCGETYTEVIPPLNHTHSYSPTVTPPSCMTQGYTTYTCKCGSSYIADYVDALGHEWDNGEVTVEPTETTAGVRTYFCIRCGEVKTEAIPPLNHTHTWSAWTVSKAATCTAAGEEIRTCSGCNEKETREVKALGHDYQNGICTRCGEKDPNAEVTPPSVPSFTDVPADAWYMDAVNYAVKNGLMQGTGNGKFEPDTVTTRAMIVTVLWRQAGEKKGDKNTFSDVPDGEWYTDAVAWAAANDIVKGTGNGKFEPAGDVTREQMVTILYRYCGNQGIDTSKTADLKSFPDAGQVNGYALDAMRWAVAEGIINGKVLDASGTTYLQPLGNASRAEIATILMRFIENILK